MKPNEKSAQQFIEEAAIEWNNERLKEVWTGLGDITLSYKKAFMEGALFGARLGFEAARKGSWYFEPCGLEDELTADEFLAELKGEK